MLGKKRGCAARFVASPSSSRIEASGGAFTLAAAIGKAANRRTVRSTASLRFRLAAARAACGSRAAVRVRRYRCAGGSGSPIGPSAPWTAFEYKNCTGTRPLPVLLSTSWNTRCNCPSWPAMAIG